MNERDRAILNNLNMFRCMSRDQIVSLHFNSLKNPINSCNSVLKRLTRDNYIKCSKRFSPYVYFPAESKIKETSQKIPHFLELVNTIIEMKAFKEPKHLMIEPKYGGKGTIEPDIFCMWYGNPMFIEVQRNVYTKEVMQKKISLYEEYYYSEVWKDESWQRPDKIKFPSILIITPTRYAIESSELKVHQSPSITDFIAFIQGNNEKPKIEKNTLKSSNGVLKVNLFNN